jgi:hypothetical protein
MVFDGGIVEDVVLSNITIQTRRFDWFWWGDGDPIHFNIKRRSEVDGTKREKEPPAGIIRNVSIRNVIAHGAGASVINGHPDSWLDGVHLDGVKLFVAHDPNAPYEDTRTALTLRYAKNTTLKDVDVLWEQPTSPTWTTGLAVDEVTGLLLDSVHIQPAPESSGPAITLQNVQNARIGNSSAPTLHVTGKYTRGIRLFQTDSNVTTAPDVAKDAIAQP